MYAGCSVLLLRKVLSTWVPHLGMKLGSRLHPRACLKHLESERQKIINLGGNDLSCYEFMANKASAELMVTLCPILDHLPACLMTRVIILKQHFRNCIPGSLVHYSSLNHRIREWHEDTVAIECLDQASVVNWA